MVVLGMVVIQSWVLVSIYEEETRVGQGVTCEYTVGGMAVPAAPDGGRSEAEWRKGGDIYEGMLDG